MSVKDKNSHQGAMPQHTILDSGSDKYMVEAVLGAGGFGITYKVLRLSDHATIAMKEYFPKALCERNETDSVTVSYLKTNSEGFANGLKDFITEAKRLKNVNVNHPNIVRIGECFKANDTAYYVMEYVDGPDLKKYITTHGKKPLTPEQALSIMRPVLSALSLLHRNYLTHLDIKHENIVLNQLPDGSLRPVLIDFGQSKHYDKKGNATSKLTNAGISPGFSPIEQYSGLKEFTPQADIYSACATLLYMLTAATPPEALELSPSKLQMSIPASVPADIRGAILQGMRGVKEDRTQSVALLASQLGLDIDDTGDSGSVTTLLNLSEGSTRNWKKPALYAAAAAIVLAIGAGIFAIIPRGGAPEVAEAPLQDTVPVTVDDKPELLAETPTPAETVAPKPEPQKEPAPAPDNKPAPAEAKEKPREPVPTPPNMEKNQAPKPEAAVNAASKALEETKPAAAANDGALLKKAIETGDYQTVKTYADKGMKEAYVPLAKHYQKTGKYAEADRYAQKGKAAGASGADNVIQFLNTIGYYD